MFGVSLPEILLVLVVILLVFGPDKLPDLARTLGKVSGSFRKSSDSLRREFYNAVYTPANLDPEISKAGRELRSIAAEIQEDLPTELLQNCEEQAKAELAALAEASEEEDDQSVVEPKKEQ
jgi:TatA/E family protein of Tat protein translocase